MLIANIIKYTFYAGTSPDLGANGSGDAYLRENVRNKTNKEWDVCSSKERDVCSAKLENVLLVRKRSYDEQLCCSKGGMAKLKISRMFASFTTSLTSSKIY